MNIGTRRIKHDQISNEMKGFFTAQDSKVPVFKHKFGDAGYDLYAVEDKWIWPFSVTKIKTNIKMEIPPGYLGWVTSRSGQTEIGNYTLAGIIDSGYRGIVHIMMSRIGLLPRKIKKGTRVAQLIIIPYMEMDWLERAVLSPSYRGTDAFGKSGIK